MAGKKSDLGPTGINLTHVVRDLRGNLSYAELSRRLAEIGREIPPLGLRRIESGERRVDADDLVALAVALDVSPISLLMPRSETGDDLVEVTGVKGRMGARRFWRWLQGSAQLSDGKYDEFLTFVARTLPPWRHREVTLVEAGLGKSLTRFVSDGNDEHGHNQ